MTDEEFAAKEKEYKAKIAELETQVKKAVEKGDEEKVAKLEARIAAIESLLIEVEEKKEEKVATPPVETAPPKVEKKEAPKKSPAEKPRRGFDWEW